ncbi:hypothetical protein A8F94_18950 [Bacillus sp. FJAT-27225]|uniref:CPBP family intramembrane glutamic endopeptidase n=1 Tax=Bacillus sp. FJAT-27225 TaxID=1743144 RepID=UPI00080C29A0|nr:CPBP family intramembrane glutamic endopeptidase [Bacillus sp. FJAT-27225]OCA83194.1 hypothetical protein A8F94_18950 [Bacillus sp. FJAT-27225]
MAKRNYAKALIGFTILDVYLNAGIAGAGSILIQLLLVAGFFPVFYFLLRWTNLNGFRDAGIDFHPSWSRNVVIGFGTGFGFWLTMYTLSWILGGYEITGIKPLSESLLTIGLVLGTFLIGSFLNDLITRGYIFAQLKGRIPLPWIFTISIAVYSFDDIWHEGFSFSNTVFSILLGLSLTYAFYKSGSIWMTTGIHWGLNVCYGLFNGTLGEANGGIFIRTEPASSSFLLESIRYFIPALMFLFVVVLLKRAKQREALTGSGIDPSI